MIASDNVLRVGRICDERVQEVTRVGVRSQSQPERFSDGRSPR